MRLLAPTSFTPAAAGFALTAITAGTGIVAAPTASAAVTSISIKTAGTKPINQVTNAWGTVTGGANTQACTQVLLGGSWSQSQCRITDANGYYAIPLTYGSGVPGTYTWRVVSGGVASSTATLTRTSATTTSTTVPDYIKGRPTDGIVLNGDSSISDVNGDNGVKVYVVRKALGVATTYADSGQSRAHMNFATVTALKAFQLKYGLAQTGQVAANTFYALKAHPVKAGFIQPGDMFNMDSWKQGSTVSAGASSATKVNATVNWALGKKTLPYIWGGTGTRGFDCSGLVLQALRAGGFDPKYVSNNINIQPPSDLSRKMWLDSELPKRSGTPVRGDMVFYRASGATKVSHVGIYLGSGRIINAAAGSVQEWPLNLNGMVIVGYKKMPGAV